MKHHTFTKILVVVLVVGLFAAEAFFKTGAGSFTESARLEADLMNAGAEKSLTPPRTATVTEESLPSSQKEHIPIFVYHSVRPHYELESAIQDQFDITPELFESQLKYLKDHGYSAISLLALADHFGKGLPLPPKPVALNFDDGWHNQYKYAFSLLKRYGFMATFFVPTGMLGHNHFMNWDEVRELDSAGMEIGDHTETHPYLSKLDDKTLSEEIMGAKKVLEKKLGKPESIFASPFGYSDSRIESVVKNGGFKLLRTGYYGLIHSSDDLFRLRSIFVSDRLSDFINALEK